MICEHAAVVIRGLRACSRVPACARGPEERAAGPSYYRRRRRLPGAHGVHGEGQMIGAALALGRRKCTGSFSQARELTCMARGLWHQAAGASSSHGLACSAAPGIDTLSSLDEVAMVPEEAAAVLAGRFRIPAQEVEGLLQSAGCSMDRLLLALMEPASHLARPLISNFHVGAVGLGGSGAVYVGVNLEFPGMPLNQSVHAEQFLIANLLDAGEASLRVLAVSAAPCGHCRQFYSELAGAESIRFVFGSADAPQPARHTLSDLLPARFGPADLLGNAGAPLLLQPQDHLLEWDDAAVAALRQRSGEAHFAAASEAALKAATQSYAPYTRCYAGAAVLLHSGAVHLGSYLESAAYNPGIHPLQAALSAAIVGGMGAYDQVAEVVVAEKSNGLVQQARTIRSLARAATGQADLRVTVLPIRERR